MTTRLDSWLALTEEEAIEPEMPILDPHHHFWERPDDVYLLENLLGDTGSGHRVNQTVFVECRSMYRTDGPHELRSVGEVEFVEGIASANVLRQSQDESGGSATAVAAGIVGNADLMLGDAVAPVLEALAEAGKGRFRGIRCTAAWDASPEINVARANSSGMLADANFPPGSGLPGAHGAVLRLHRVSPAVAGSGGHGPRLPRLDHHTESRRPTSGYRPLRRAPRGTDAGMAAGHRRGG